MCYLQLAHNEWDAATKMSRPRVLYSFGRATSSTGGWSNGWRLRLNCYLRLTAGGLLRINAQESYGRVKWSV